MPLADFGLLGVLEDRLAVGIECPVKYARRVEEPAP
jgi:hypothetical protein